MESWKENRGVFFLRNVFEAAQEGIWVDPDNVWISPSPFFGLPPNTGYFGGGTNLSGPLFIMDKITYTTDTTEPVPGASLTRPRFTLAATGNQTDGYFGGGDNISGPGPSLTTRMDRVSYASDTTVSVPSANFAVERAQLAAAGNSTYGYFGGGQFPYRTLMDRVTYASDTRETVPSANLTVGRYLLAATGNSTHGYFGGGAISRLVMEKVTYASDTAAAVPTVQVPLASLTRQREGLAATGNLTHGYFGGGDNEPFMDKLTYSSDTTDAAPSANLTVAREGLAATGNLTHGYFGGGTIPAYLTTMDRITYASDTPEAIPSAGLSTERSYLAASSAKANALPGTITLFPAPSDLPTRFSDGVQETSDAGYFGGGYPGPGPLSIMDKLDYPSDTTAAVPGASLDVARYDLAATGSLDAGYFGGGYAFGPNNTATVQMDKVNYATDTTAAVPGANLGIARHSLAATGNSTHGYFGGGRIESTSLAVMERIIYSSDTREAVPSANLGIARHSLAATGNSTHGYFGGGDTSGSYITPIASVATMERIIYSSSTREAVPSANLGTARCNFAATGNSTHGYFGGGETPATRVATMERIIYSSSTREAVPGSNLTVARSDLAATGNSTHGYFGGGWASRSTMDKVAYSSDTPEAIPGAGLSLSRYNLAASSARANALPVLEPPAPAPTSQVVSSTPVIV